MIKQMLFLIGFSLAINVASSRYRPGEIMVYDETTEAVEKEIMENFDDVELNDTPNEKVVEQPNDFEANGGNSNAPGKNEPMEKVEINQGLRSFDESMIL